MPRIRSVHPGFFTDADIVSMSDSAQLFFIGLWTEADDYGVFEWKPTSLKIKLRPASTAPVDPLLEELLTAERILRFEYSGRQYGAIRNFCRYQRPKSPKSVHHMPDEFRQFVGLEPSHSEIEPRHPPPMPQKRETGAPQRPPIPQKGEISPQMEDGGWRMEEEDGKGEKLERSESPTGANGKSSRSARSPPGKPEPTPRKRSFGEDELVRYACGPAPNQPLAEAPATEQTFRWPLIEVEGRSFPHEVPPEWLGETYRSHPMVDGYAAQEAFGEYWTGGKGAGTERTERGWHQCWRKWIGREKAGRSTDWINRFGYSRHLHGQLVEARAAAC